MVNIGGSELKLNRNWFSGHFTCEYKGKKRILRAWWNPFTYRNWGTKYEFRFIIESPKGKKKVIIKQVSKRFLAPFFPFKYLIYIDGKLEKNIESY